MTRFDDHRPPLFMEREQEQAGYTLTPHEHLQEGLADRPSLFDSSSGATGRRALPENEEQS